MHQPTPPPSEFEMRCLQLRGERAREAAHRHARSQRKADPMRLRVLDWVLGKVLRG